MTKRKRKARKTCGSSSTAARCWDLDAIVICCSTATHYLGDSHTDKVPSFLSVCPDDLEHASMPGKGKGKGRAPPVSWSHLFKHMPGWMNDYTTPFWPFWGLASRHRVSTLKPRQTHCSKHTTKKNCSPDISLHFYYKYM